MSAEEGGESSYLAGGAIVGIATAQCYLLIAWAAVTSARVRDIVDIDSSVYLAHTAFEIKRGLRLDPVLERGGRLYKLGRGLCRVLGPIYFFQSGGASESNL